MLWVSLSNRQEVIVVKYNSSFLHDSERSERSRLLNVPDIFFIDTLENKRTSYE